jgi:hypothetical protein
MTTLRAQCRGSIRLSCTVAAFMAAHAAPAGACSIAVRYASYRPPGAVDLWVSAMPDTFFVGLWRDIPGVIAEISRPDPLGRTRTPVDPALLTTRTYGQVGRVERVDADDGGEFQRALAQSGGRALFLPRGYRSDCLPIPFEGGANWLPAVSLVTAVPRPTSEWINGIPTFSMHAYSAPYPKGNPTGPALSVPDYWSLRTALPRPNATSQERAVALTNVRTWIGTHMTMVDAYPANLILRELGIRP